MTRWEITVMALAIVFGGGGARGAFQAGVWEVLAPYLNPRFVIGSSIGAVNAWATTRLEAGLLCQWWRTQAPKHVLPYEQDALKTPLTRLAALPQLHSWPALAVCTPLGKSRPHTVTLTPDQAAMWLTASCALPGWFAPVRVAGKPYVDGGVLNDLPVAIARELGATEILAIGAGGLGPTPDAKGVPCILPPTGLGRMFDWSLAARSRALAAGRQAGLAWMATNEFRRLVEI
ncbi:MAG: patatin-like phospholipase family protein [Lactobacillus sp.]|nr:patatin-like phospholipase family protein [Lactobacillus sp.]